MGKIAAMILMLAVLAGCDSAEEAKATATTQLQTIAKGEAGTTAVEVLADHELHLGWQTLHVRVTQGGKAVTQAAVALHPLMTMGTDQHACPLVQPATTAAAVSRHVMIGRRMQSSEIFIAGSPGRRRAVALHSDPQHASLR